MIAPQVRFSLTAALVAALPALASAQIEYGGQPPSTYYELPGAVPTATMRSVDAAVLLEEDAAQPKGAFRFGDNIEVDLGFEDGVWTDLPNGDRVWRLRIESVGAFSLSFVFSEYHLPSGAELYVYNDDLSTTRGMYNYLNNKPDGQMAIQPVGGNAVTLEYFEPAWVEFEGALRTGTVVHDYRDIIAIMSEPASIADGGCEIDVACAAGAPWQNQIRATARILNGGLLCTGSLLNNTAFDGTQLFITANHCGTLGSAIFLFKYQKSGCGSGGAPTSSTVQGSVQLATSSGIDYRLVRITPSIPASYDPYWAGWDRSGAFPTNTVTVHHPNGGPKKISFDNDSPQKSGTDWRIIQWDLGVTEGGSSGCPLYNQNGRFVGQLWGGAAFCGFPFDDFYGRLDSEWSQVASHLDPIGAGSTTIDGWEIGGGGPSGPSIVAISPSTVNALIPGSTQTISIIGSGFTPTTTIEVDGVILSGIPAPFTYITSTLMTMDMPQVDNLGVVNVKLTEGALSDTAQMTVVEPALPQLQAGNGDQPVTTFSFSGIDVTMSSQVNDLFLLFWSPSGSPSTLPGFVDLEIGSGFASLFSVANFTIDSTQAWNTVNLPLVGVPPLTTFFLEGTVIRAGGLAFPVDSSNRQECQVLF